MIKTPTITIWDKPQPYSEIYAAMRRFTKSRTDETPDQIWVLQHQPVYTIGQTPRIANAFLHKVYADIVHIDRGGDVTYHAPGQWVIYPLLNLRRNHLYVKEYVKALQEAVIRTLSDFNIKGVTHLGAPGVYVSYPGGCGEFAGQAKIASLGIKVSRGCTYHGLALNVSMDLTGFQHIAPCGYQGLRTIDMKTLNFQGSLLDVRDILIAHLLTTLTTYAYEY